MKKIRSFKFIILPLIFVLILTGVFFGCTEKTTPVDKNHICPTPNTMEEIYNSRKGSVCTIRAGNQAGTGFLAAALTVGGDRVLYIATNYHVVKESIGTTMGATTIKFHGESTEYSGGEIALSGYDIYHDVAVLKVIDKDTGKDPQKLKQPVIEKNSSTNPPLLVSTQALLAFGNFKNEGIEVFRGEAYVASSEEAYVTSPESVVNFGSSTYKPVTRVTININEGCSGGPVFNAYNQFVGIGVGQRVESGEPVAGISYIVSAAIAEPIIKKAVLSDNESKVHKIDAFMSYYSSVDFSKGQLKFTADMADNELIVDWLGANSLQTEWSGTWLQKGDKLLKIGNVNLETLNFTALFAELAQYVFESAAPDGLKPYLTNQALCITFLSGGQTKTLTYNNIKKLNMP